MLSVSLYSGAVNPDHSLSLPAFSTATLFFSLLILRLGLLVLSFQSLDFSNGISGMGYFR